MSPEILQSHGRRLRREIEKLKINYNKTHAQFNAVYLYYINNGIVQLI